MSSESAEKSVKIVSLVVMLVLALVVYQMLGLKEEQQKMLIENARLAGIVEGQGKTLSDQQAKLAETLDRVDKTEKSVSDVGVIVNAQQEKITEHDKAIENTKKELGSVKRQIKDIKENPVIDVVVAATSEDAKKEAFDKWAKHHPDWKSRRSCMKAQMAQNQSISLTDAYNACG